MFQWLITGFIYFICFSAHAGVCVNLITPKFPSAQQSTDFTCGPSCIDSVARRFLGKSPGEGALAQMVDTTMEFGTSPENMEKGLRLLGLNAEVKEHLTYKDLEGLLNSHQTAILNIQQEGEGHWVVLEELDLNHITVMDPWSGLYDKIPWREFTENWYDRHQNRFYLRMAIVVDSAPEKIQSPWAITKSQ